MAPTPSGEAPARAVALHPASPGTAQSMGGARRFPRERRRSGLAVDGLSHKPPLARIPLPARIAMRGADPWHRYQLTSVDRPASPRPYPLASPESVLPEYAAWTRSLGLVSNPTLSACGRRSAQRDPVRARDHVGLAPADDGHRPTARRGLRRTTTATAISVWAPQWPPVPTGSDIVRQCVRLRLPPPARIGPGSPRPRRRPRSRTRQR
jgi:hypothetical protein